MCLLAAGAVSCSKAAPEGLDGRTEIRISAVSAQTKAAVGGGSLPDDYTIYLSSFFNNGTAEESSANYCTGVPFRKEGSSSWSASPVLYWPLGGSLDFLALASKDVPVTGRAIWHEDNVTRIVGLPVEDEASLESEILYARAASKKVVDGSVRMDFLHSQTWLQFIIEPYEAGTTKIDSIVIRKPYLGGKLRVDNGVYFKAEWDFRGHFRQDYTLPGSRNLELNGGQKILNILLPEQNACDLTIYFTQRNRGDTSWENPTRRTSFTKEANPDPWYAGQKTIYTMTVQKHLTVSATIHEWTEDNKQIKID